MLEDGADHGGLGDEGEDAAATGKGWNRVRLSRWTTTGSVIVADAVRIR